jgi:putative membrane protein
MHPHRPIPNEGSTARDHLAGERTFLAWIRTGLGVVGLGVVTGKLLETEGVIAEVIGLALVALGALMLGYALARFRKLTVALESGEFQPAFWGPLVVSTVAIGVTVGAVVVLLLP